MSNNSRRQEARERARLARIAAQRRERRVTVLLRSSIVVGVLAVLTVVTLVIMAGVKPAGPGPRNLADGIIIGEGSKAVRTAALSAGEEPSALVGVGGGSGPATIKLFVDYQCPGCGALEKENADYLAGLVESGAATLEYHPVAILDRMSLGARYSSRAANAAACVADLSPDAFPAVTAALFAAQPEEGTRGPDDAELAKTVTAVKGLQKKAEIRSCIDDQRFGGWVKEATDRALAQGAPGTDLDKLSQTPTVVVNGKVFDASKGVTFQAFVASVVGDAAKADDSAKGDSATETPAPEAGAPEVPQTEPEQQQ
ncbi:DsbA family protein [Frondihabitans cladoniiphilus]|uniref:Thioredoxin domain-containing protein n=1 Tax=Frondihabitans cladoniiphilus TaxID=715785 RepID=A0ABP8W278_9MICO